MSAKVKRCKSQFCFRCPTKILTCNLQFIPKYKAQHRVRTKSEKRRPAALVKTPQTLSGKSAHKAVSNTTVEQPSAGKVRTLVVQSCWHNIEWSHRRDHYNTTGHAGGKSIQPTGRRKQLQSTSRMTTTNQCDLR